MKETLKDTAWAEIAKQFKGAGIKEQVYNNNRVFDFSSLPVQVKSDIKEFHGKETLFYILLAVLLFFAFMKFSFPKYISDLFQVAFRTTMKQRQIGEQLIQTPIPSILFNLFFLVTASLYIYFVFQHYHIAPELGFWLVFLYSFCFLAVIYIIKFITLKLSGALFNISDTTNGYIFIVFMINKIIGIFLIPFLIVLAFSDYQIYQPSLTLSFIAVAGLLAYRFILSYSLIRNQIRVNPFHFLLYLLAFEIAPLLLIYKLLLLWF